ncbi:MAG: GHKL domain-containing protein [Rubrivivax sp.]|nr:GHKL domain-containing protein [Rubrivivax sp.]
MPRTNRPERAAVLASGRAVGAPACGRVRAESLLAGGAGLLATVRAGASPLSPATAGGDLFWLFLAVAFAGSALAFFAWGRLSAGTAARPLPLPGQPAPGDVRPEEELAATARTDGEARVAPAPAGPLPRQAQAARTPEPPGVQAWLAAFPGVALVASRAAATCTVRALTPAARALWPHADEGTPIEALAGLPAACRVTIGALNPGESASLDGWRLVALAGAPGSAGTLAWVLVWQLPAVGDGDVFGSTLSHDLRAPVRVVEGFTRIVKEDYGALLDRVGNDHLDRVLGAAARMNLMIDALLTMARLSAQPLARQPVDLTQLAQYVIEDLRRGDPAREVDVELEPGLLVSGDPTLLRLVLENLIGNAWKYTARAENPRITVRAVQHEDRRAFEVGDNGAGFDMRSADRLFGLFQRLHSASDFPGHGVGLASVRRIVQRHGGDIWAEGRPGQGATFTFTLG